MVAEIFGRDHLVEFRREGVIFRPARLVGAARIRPRRLARRFVVAEFAVVERVAGGGLRAFHRAFRHFVGGRLRLVGAHFLRGVGIGRAFGAGLIVLAVLILVVVLVVIGVGIAVVAEIERRQQIVHEVAELGLVLGDAAQLVEPRADLVFQRRAPEIDHLLGGRRRRHAGQALAHQHRQRIRQRRVGAVGDLVVLAAMEMIVEHRGEVLRNARHPPRADRFDAGLLDRLEHAARLRIARHQLAVHLWIVTGEFQRDRIRHGRARSRHRAWSSCAPAPAAAPCRARGPDVRRRTSLPAPAPSAIARRHDVTARLNGSVGASFDPVRNLEFDVVIATCASPAVVPAKAGTHNHRRSLSSEL